MLFGGGKRQADAIDRGPGLCGRFQADEAGQAYGSITSGSNCGPRYGTDVLGCS